MASPDYVQLIEAAWAAFNARDADALVELCAPDVEVGTLLTVAETRAWRGHGGVREMMAQQDEAFSELRGEFGEPERRGDWFIVEGRLLGRGRASGAEVAVDFVQVIRIGNRVAKAWRFVRSREEADAIVAAREGSPE